ncbi:MAG: LamG domain-containing protein, partial [Acidobacteria bacterium]|nr:LamG domain-containing protein [Acidobacteriota bacterium]
MNITNNIFDLRFYGSGTDLSGLLTFEYGAPTSGTISGNSFTHGVGVTVTSSDAVGQFSSQSLFPAITNFQPGSITSSGLSITNNTFKFANASQTNTSTGFTGRPAAIYNIQGVQATGPITITGNSFEGYGYLATGASVPEVVSTTDPGRGHVIEFDGIQDHGIFTLPANIGAQGSVSVWIRPTDVGSTRRAVFNGGGVEITVRNGTIYFYPNSGQDSSLTYAVNNSFTANTWTHVIVTWDFATKNTQIYFNNVVASYQSSYAPPRSSWTVAADTAGKLVHIGRDPANPGREFPGRMDDIAVFSSVLTTQQRTDLYTGTNISKASIPSLVAYWSPSASDVGKTSIAGSGGTSTILSLSSPVSTPHNFIDVTGGTSPVNISGNSYSTGAGNLLARIKGSTADDIIYGTPGDDTIDGLAGNDVLAGGTGTNTVTGGPGTDAGWFAGNNTDYGITGSANNVTVTSNPGITPTTNTLLIDIEFLQYGNEAPTATITYSDPVSGEAVTSKVKYLVTFSKEVTGVSLANFSLDSATDTTASPPFLFPHPSAVITSITGSGTTREVTIDLGTATGQVRLRLANSSGIADNALAPLANIPVISPIYNRSLVVADVPEGGVVGGGGTSTIIPVTTDDIKNVSAPLTNLNPFPVVATYSSNISQGLEASNCIGSVSNVPRGSCSINTAGRMESNNSLYRKQAQSQTVQTVVWSGTLQAGETVIINYQVQVTATQQSNSLMITSTGQFINPATGLVVANLPAIILSYAVSVTPAGPGAAV